MPEWSHNPPAAFGEAFEFEPVPLLRTRQDGWSALRQRRFVAALSAMGSVSAAAKAVGSNRVSSYRLRARPGAEGFAQAWDEALELGKSYMWDVAMSRAIEGTTTITVRRGGTVHIAGGVDGRLLSAAMRDGARPG